MLQVVCPLRELRDSLPYWTDSVGTRLDPDLRSGGGGFDPQSVP